jgi:ubiquinone/menaquinone biosynthesis C-methylase UbiE
MKMTAMEKHFVNRPGHTRTVAARAQQLLGRLNFQAGWRYLDVGCGVGAAAHEIAAKTGLEVTGVDLDPRQIEAAKNRGGLPNLNFRVMDATRLDFQDGAFDIVACSMVTHHIPDWERALVEMVRVLRSGGYLVYTDLVFRSWLAKLGRRLIRFAGFPSINALDSAAASAGLVQVYEQQRAGEVEAIWLKSV